MCKHKLVLVEGSAVVLMVSTGQSLNEEYKDQSAAGSTLSSFIFHF